MERGEADLRPIIAGGVGEDVTLGIESAAADGLVQLIGRLQLGACVFVPEAVPAVRSHGGQRAMHRVEGNAIHLQMQSGGETCRRD